MTYSSYAFYIINLYIQHIHKYTAQFKQTRSAESLHQLRVYSRRLRNALRFFKDLLPKKKLKKWNKAISLPAQRSSKLRDLDVHVEFLISYNQKVSNLKERQLIERLKLLLSEKREDSEHKVIKALNRIYQQKTLSKILRKIDANKDVHKKSMAKIFYKRIYKKMQCVLSFEKIVYKLKEIEGLHQMRIAVKHLRYSLESLVSFYGVSINKFIVQILNFHTLLGQLHDFDVWEIRLDKLKDEHKKDKDFYQALSHLQEYCHAQREVIYKKFVAAWEKSKKQDLFADMDKFFKLAVHGG